MFGFKKQKVYPILFSPEAPLQYAMALYSGNKQLTMLIDTGATISSITKEALQGCDYKYLKSSTNIITANGLAKAKQVELNFGLNINTEQNYFTTAFIASKKDLLSHFQTVALDGIISMDFLRLCQLDFVKLKFKVYQL